MACEWSHSLKSIAILPLVGQNHPNMTESTTVTNRLSGEAQRALSQFVEKLKQRNPHEPEFHQAVYEVARDVLPYELSVPEFREARVLERLCEPDRVIIFRVTWMDDKGRIHVNRGYRVQMSNLLGPYKGGLRFSPYVNLSVLKFLAFEQIFKNSLTTLSLGAGKGGADFDPKGKSEAEIMRFCQAFMIELHRHIGRYWDVPAGDIGVGTKEIGYMYGVLLRMRGPEQGAFTGKGVEVGGSFLRPEATGYGCVYFVQEMLSTIDEDLEGKRVVVSGAGNVALHAAEKLLQVGATVLTLSDTTGTLYVKSGITLEMLDFIKKLKAQRGRSLQEVCEKFKDVEFRVGTKPWCVPCEIALPCAVENELGENDAKELIKNGCMAVAEGANMPCTPQAIEMFLQRGVLFGPGKAANAGGVAVSGLEMIQNAMRLQWGAHHVDRRLREIMHRIHEQCVQFGREDNGRINYVKGANLAAYHRVAKAMVSVGVV